MAEILVSLTLILSSPNFTNGGELPEKFTGFGEDISPELHLENLCEEAKYIAIAFCDEDMPLSKEYCHWICWNIPAANVIPQNIPAGKIIENPVQAIQGIGYGKHKYRGPKPPFHSKHYYHFIVYALDSELELPPSAKFNRIIIIISNQ